MHKAQSIVRLESHTNRTPTGRASATAARKLARYLTYGRGRPAEQAQRPQRGVWFGENGRQLSHAEVMEWVQAQGKTLPYTHQLILSVSRTRLSPDAYRRALQAGGALFPEWRLIVHRDTVHDHAHVVTFGEDEVNVRSDGFRQWWRAVRRELDRQQQRRLETERTQQHQQEMATRLRVHAMEVEL